MSQTHISSGGPIRVTVSALVFEQDPAPTSRTVQLMLDDDVIDAVDLTSRDEVEAVVFALQDAMDMVFPEPPLEPCASQEDEAEFEAALQEVVQRAEHPFDINRLVSATIRLRRAYLGCTE